MAPRPESDRPQLEYLFAAETLPAPSVWVETTSAVFQTSLLAGTDHLSDMTQSSTFLWRNGGYFVALRLNRQTGRCEISAVHRGPVAFPWLDMAQFTDLAFGLLSPDTQTVRRTAELRRNRLLSSCVAGVTGSVLAEKPNTALAKLGRIGGVNLCLVTGLILGVLYSPLNPGQFSLKINMTDVRTLPAASLDGR